MWSNICSIKLRAKDLGHGFGRNPDGAQPVPVVQGEIAHIFHRQHVGRRIGPVDPGRSNRGIIFEDRRKPFGIVPFQHQIQLLACHPVKLLDQLVQVNRASQRGIELEPPQEDCNRSEIDLDNLFDARPQHFDDNSLA